MAISYFLPNTDVIVLGTNYASSRLRCSPKSQPELPMTNANLNKLCPSLVAPVSQFTERFLECNVHTHSYKTSLLHNITNTDMSDILVYLSTYFSLSKLYCCMLSFVLVIVVCAHWRQSIQLSNIPLLFSSDNTISKASTRIHEFYNL